MCSYLIKPQHMLFRRWSVDADVRPYFMVFYSQNPILKYIRDFYVKINMYALYTSIKSKLCDTSVITTFTVLNNVEYVLLFRRFKQKIV